MSRNRAGQAHASDGLDPDLVIISPGRKGRPAGWAGPPLGSPTLKYASASRSGGAGGRPGAPRQAHLRLRALGILFGVALAFLSVTWQLVTLARLNQGLPQVSISRPLETGTARPDLVDRNGRLIASDVVMPSLYADPSMLLDVDEVIEGVSALLPGLDLQRLRLDLSDRSRRFVWIKRGLSPALAQKIHDLGLPGLHFRDELQRAYPGGRLAGHVVGFTNIDNVGLAGIEKWLDARDIPEAVHAARLSERRPVQLSLDVGVQFALEDELQSAVARYDAKAAAGLVIDVRTGEVLAAASLPTFDPTRPAAASQAARTNRLLGGAYELGSVFKLFTVAQALENGHVTPETLIDVTRPLRADGHEIVDPHPSRRPLSVVEVFTHSSNVGAGVLALAAGSDAQRAFLQQLGLSEPLSTEAGRSVAPRWPRHIGAIETVTISFGHGLAVAPMQFAAAVLPLVNGGRLLRPTFLKRPAGWQNDGARALSNETSEAIRAMMRANVAHKDGTGRRAAVPGLDVGGKTGTAEIAIDGRYRGSKVISSFVAAFPMSNPRYLTLVSLFEPGAVSASGGALSAGRNAAPTTGKIIERIAPLLGLTAARH